MSGCEMGSCIWLLFWSRYLPGKEKRVSTIWVSREGVYWMETAGLSIGSCTAQQDTYRVRICL